MRERTRLEKAISAYRSVENELNDSIGLLDLAEAENDKAMVADAETALVGLRARAEAMKLESMLSGEPRSMRPRSPVRSQSSSAAVAGVGLPSTTPR